jgi:hypothetical protein
MASSLDSFDNLGSSTKFRYVAMQVGETEFQRILLREFVSQRQPDVLGVIPGELLGHQ